MLNEEAMLDHLTPNFAKSFPRKMMNNLDMASLLKQVQVHSKIPSPLSNHSMSPPHHSISPNVAIPSTSTASNNVSLLVTPVAVSAPSTSLESSK